MSRRGNGGRGGFCCCCSSPHAYFIQFVCDGWPGFCDVLLHTHTSYFRCGSGCGARAAGTAAASEGATGGGRAERPISGLPAWRMNIYPTTAGLAKTDEASWESRE